MRLLPRILPALLLVLPALAAQRFTLEHLARLTRLSDVELSPDGKSVAVIVSRPNYQDNRYDATLLLVDASTGAQRPLTEGRRGLASPRFSPSGDRLAFLAAIGPAADARRQVFILPMTGGDARQLTNVATGVQQFAWRPDGQMIAFAAFDEPAARAGEERHNDSFEVGNDDMFIRAAAQPTHIWTIPAAGGSPKRLTSGAWSLPATRPPGSPASPLSWSPDGRLIAFVKVATPHSGDGDKSAVHLLDVDSGAMRPLTGRAMDESQPLFSPDGRHIAYWYPRDGQSKNVSEIHLAPAGGGDGRSLTRALDRNLMRAIWTPDGKSLLVGGNDRATVGLWIQPLAGDARRLELGPVVPASAFWVDAALASTGAFAFAGSEPRRPAELYYVSSPTAAPKRLTDFHRDLAALDLGASERFDFDCADGFRCDGVLTYPPEFDKSRRYPLVLLIHGGPRSASKLAFSSRAQLMAARGWVVFEPNYRGSDNLGNAFQSAIFNDSGAGPGRDVMAGVDALKKRGFVDPDRVAVSGWSYGGYMTTWLIGNYTGWRVAVAGAAVTDLLHQYHLGDANVRRAKALGGSPYRDNRMPAYLEQSPITYARNIRTPTLILSDTGDARVPITQSFALYGVLRDLGVETRFIAYPIPGHSPADPVRQRDVDRRWIDWIAQHFEGPPQPASGARQ